MIHAPSRRPQDGVSPPRLRRGRAPGPTFAGRHLGRQLRADGGRLSLGFPLPGRPAGIDCALTAQGWFDRQGSRSARQWVLPRTHQAPAPKTNSRQCGPSASPPHTAAHDPPSSAPRMAWISTWGRPPVDEATTRYERCCCRRLGSAQWGSPRRPVGVLCAHACATAGRLAPVPAGVACEISLVQTTSPRYFSRRTNKAPSCRSRHRGAAGRGARLSWLDCAPGIHVGISCCHDLWRARTAWIRAMSSCEPHRRRCLLLRRYSTNVLGQPRCHTRLLVRPRVGRQKQRRAHSCEDPPQMGGGRGESQLLCRPTRCGERLDLVLRALPVGPQTVSALWRCGRQDKHIKCPTRRHSGRAAFNLGRWLA